MITLTLLQTRVGGDVTHVTVFYAHIYFCLVRFCMLPFRDAPPPDPTARRFVLRLSYLKLNNV